LAASVVPNAKLVVLPLLRSVAVQFPLILVELEFEAHPTSASPTTIKTATAKCFMDKNPPGSKSEGRFKVDAETGMHGGFRATLWNR
jgi:hypothetical protein